MFNYKHPFNNKQNWTHKFDLWAQRKVSYHFWTDIFWGFIYKLKSVISEYWRKRSCCDLWSYFTSVFRNITNMDEFSLRKYFVEQTIWSNNWLYCQFLLNNYCWRTKTWDQKPLELKWQSHLFPGKLDRTNPHNSRKIHLYLSGWLCVGFNNVNITYSWR